MKRRTLLTSVLVIVLCLGLIAGSTYALFTSESKVNIAVTSGKVNIVATLGSLKLYSADATLTEGDKVDKINPLDKTGTILPTDPQGAFAGTYYYRDRTLAAKFLNGGTAKIETNTETSTQSLSIQKITPGDKVTVNVNITNDSNVAIQYRVKVNVLSGLKLYEALVVKVDGVSLKGVRKVSNWTYLDVPATEEAKILTPIPVEVYLPLDVSDENLQDLATSMQITVEAVQGNAKTTNEVLTQEVTAVKAVEANTTTTITDDDGLVVATVPYLALDTQNISIDSLTLKVKPTDSEYNIAIESATQEVMAYDVKVLVTNSDTGAIRENNTEVINVKLFVGTGLTGVKLYHNGLEMNSSAYSYDSTTGFITFDTNSFSEYSVVYNKDIAVEKNNTITVYTPTEDDSVYEDAEGNVVQITVDDKKELVIDTNGVAYIAKSAGTVFYKSLAEAIQAAAEGETIVMAKDSTSVDGYEIDKTISLDTNGKTITVTAGANVNNRAFKVTSGTFTVYGGGTIDAQGVATSTTGTEGTGCYGAFRAEVGTELSLSDLTLKNYRPWGLNVKVLGASATLDNVKIVSVCGGGIEVTDDDGANGNVQGYARLTNCAMTQSDFRDWCSVPVSVSGNSQVDVYSTEYVGEYGVYVFSSGGTINIYGGSFTATSHDVLMTSYDANYDNDAIINVYGGTFVGTIKNVSALAHEFINIYGGTFDHNPTAYVETAEQVKDNGDGTYTVISKLDVMKNYVESKGYTVVSTGVETAANNYGFNKNGYTYVQYADGDLEYRYYQDGKVYLASTSNYTGTSLTVDNVDGICYSAFTDNDTIKTLTINCDLEFAAKVLDKNETMESVVFAEGVTKINNRILFDSKVNSVTLPSTLKTIEECAFFKAKGLTLAEIPASVTTIGQQAFVACTELTTITFKGSPTINMYYIARGCEKLTDVWFLGESTVLNNSQTKSMTFTNKESGDASKITIHFATSALKDSFLTVDGSSTGLTLVVIE